MENIFVEIQRDLKTLIELYATKGNAVPPSNVKRNPRLFPPDVVPPGVDLWLARVESWLNKFISSDGNLRTDVIENFRRETVFVYEMPTKKQHTPRAWLDGYHRGTWKYMKERLQILKQEGDIDLLKKYPISSVGNPIIAEIEGFRFNKRWLNNLRYLSLVSKLPNSYLEKPGSALLDIGGAYGALLYLLKQEYPTLKLGIVEFPEQLLLTRYFLKTEFPELKINSLKEAIVATAIDEEFLERFDIIFLPIECYKKITPGVFGAVSNFFSLGEMSEDWFFRYICGGALQAATYFITINRFQSSPTYDTNLTILDYRLHNYNKLHFQQSNHEQYSYRRDKIFFMKKEYYSSRSFEFVGEQLPGTYGN
jgi:putative sugar O-methyltransferase